MDSISVLLQKANLSQYVAPLLEVGADDVDQLRALSEQEFLNLLDMIGMGKKFFHVLRFRKAINRSAANNNLICQTSSNSSTHTVTVYATQLDDPNTTCTMEPVNPSPQQTPSCNMYKIPLDDPKPEPSGTSFTDLMSTTPSSSSSSRKSLVVTSHQLQNLVDDSVMVQKSLGPSPISPDVWDEGRKEIFRKSSQLFCSNVAPLTEQEELMNEASYQLCLWDPTLLVRQKDLYTLSRKLVQQFLPSTSIGISNTKHLAFDNNNIWSKIPPYSVNRGPDGKFRSCFEENYERRELQMQEIELLLAENSSKEKTKQALLLQAKEKMDYSSALKIQEELSLLGKTQRELKSEMSRLRKVQRRSLRHQELKKSKKGTDQASSSIAPPTSYALQLDTSGHGINTFTTTMSPTENLRHVEVSSPLVEPVNLQTYINHKGDSDSPESPPTTYVTTPTKFDSSMTRQHGINTFTTTILDNSSPVHSPPTHLHAYIHHSPVPTVTIATNSLHSNQHEITEISPVPSPQRSINPSMKIESSVL